MGGTSEARCKPWRREDEAQELGDDDPCPTQYPESCRTSKTGIEAASETQGLGRASNRGLCTPRGNGIRCSLIDLEPDGRCDPRFPQQTRVTETRPRCTLEDDEKELKQKRTRF